MDLIGVQEVRWEGSGTLESGNYKTKGLQDRNNLLLHRRTVENKGKLIITEILPSVQKHDI